MKTILAIGIGLTIISCQDNWEPSRREEKLQHQVDSLKEALEVCKTGTMTFDVGHTKSGTRAREIEMELLYDKSK